MITWLTLLLACGPTEPPPEVEAPQTTNEVPARSAIVLYASPTALVVHHEGTEDRVTPGAAVYAVPAADLTADLQPGDRITLKTREKGAGLQVKQVARAGTGPLPERASATTHRLTGTVVNKETARVTVDHDPIEGVMGGMIMSFLAHPDDIAPLEGGDRIEATMVSSPTGYVLVELRPIGTGDAALREDIDPLLSGDVFPATEITLADGTKTVIGAGQPQRTAITFLYTTCPDPSFCPALSARLQTLQHELASDARIVSITIDPEIDTPAVLQRYAAGMSANPGTWQFARLEPEWLQRVALLSGMVVTVENGRIAHLMRMVVTDRDGTVIERYDDNEWPLDRVASQLRTGQPRLQPGQGGSRYGRP